MCAAKVATRRADDLADGDARGRRARRVGVHAHPDHAPRPRRPPRPVHGGPAPGGTCSRSDALTVEVAEANGWDVDERAAEAEEIELDGIKAKEGCWDVLGYAWAAVTSGSTWREGLRAVRRAARLGAGRGGHRRRQRLARPRPRPAVLRRRRLRRARRRRRRRAHVRPLAPRARARASPRPTSTGGTYVRAQLGDGDLADYFTKMAHEVTAGHRKEGRTPRRPDSDAATRRRGRHLRGPRWPAGGSGRKPPTAAANSPGPPADETSAILLGSGGGQRRGDRRRRSGSRCPDRPSGRHPGMARDLWERLHLAHRRRGARPRRRSCLARSTRIGVAGRDR